MAIGATVRKSQKSAVDTPKVAPNAADAKRTYSPEFLAEHEAVMARVREEGAKRIKRSVERAIAMGIIDKEGNLLRKDLPPDMVPGADRDFGG